MNFKEYCNQVLNESVIIDLTNWRTVTGKSLNAKPNPEQNGRWSFKFSKNDENPFFISGKYNDALKQAKEKAKQLNKTIIYVLG